MNKSNRLHLTTLFLPGLILFCGSLMADVRLPSVIGNNMVLQQATTAPIWGWADPGEKITVKTGWKSFGGYNAIADKDGRWRVKIRTPDAGGPYTLTILGNNTIELANLLAGEVWVCSGQSNMAWIVAKADDAGKEIAAANYPAIRLFNVPQKIADTPREDCDAEWVECTPETIADFSAVAYFFGRYLHKEHHVPIGLIHTSWGGTPAESWTRKEILEADEDYRPILERYARAVENDPHAPSVLYNGMIAPLIPYAIKGAIWYQGESNAERAYQYRKLFPAMITNWRDDWGQGAFPFYFVQIAPFDYNWGPANMCPELREAQMMTLSLKNTGMAVTMDIGNPADIHPANKQDVGKRLALWALAKDYGRKDIVYSGPIYQSMKIEGDKIRLSFEYDAGGLTAGPQGLENFTIAGTDKNFVKAQTQIDGTTLLAWSPEIAEPKAVRYCWDNISEGTLFNKAGLPASSFRTDDWPGVTADAK